MIVTLPWPDKLLSPNSRKHWGAKAPIKAKAREDAATATHGAMGRRRDEIRAALAGEAPIAIAVRFYPPDARHRDDDNMIASFKAARDGIADALGVNDRRFRPVYRFEPPAKPGRVEFELSTGCGKPVCSKVLAPQESAVTDQNRPITEAV